MSNGGGSVWKDLLAAATLLAVALFIGFAVGWFSRGSWQSSARPQVDTVWRTVRDTVHLTETVPAGTVIVKVPVVVRDTVRIASNDNLFASDANSLTSDDNNSTWCADTLHTSHRDSATVAIPIEQRTYEGEYYRAVVQGYRPELVGIDIRLPQPTVSAEPRKWWSITLGPQLGYGFTPAGWQPYAGLGVSVGISF